MHFFKKSTRASIISLFLWKESTHRRHISKLVDILLIGFGVFALTVFFLATTLHYYEQWKRSRRPLLSGGPPRGWHLRQLQRGSEDASSAPAADSSPDYYTAQDELNLLESEQERTEAAHSRLEDAQWSAESAAACLATFRTATYRYELTVLVYYFYISAPYTIAS